MESYLYSCTNICETLISLANCDFETIHVYMSYHHGSGQDYCVMETLCFQAPCLQSGY